MKVAIIYDAITEFGGAERVLLSLLHIYPQADIYTAVADKKIIKTFFPLLHPKKLHTLPQWAEGLALHTSLAQLLAPIIWKYFNLDAYDVVLSKPAHLMSNLITTRGIHIQYIHTPPRNIFGIVPPTPLQRATHYDRFIIPRYRHAIASTPFLLTNSRHMQRRIATLLGVNVEVIYPPVRTPTRMQKRAEGRYYLSVGRLEKEKHIELAIIACNTLKLPLMIVGKTNEPRYEQYLRSIAGPTITFLGFRSDSEIRALYKHAIAFLFTARDEDFGIAPVEAIANGVPVIAYYGGGTKETVKEGVTGRFFYVHTAAALTNTLRAFNPSEFRQATLYTHAKAFSEVIFKKQITAYINASLKKAGVTVKR